MLLRYPATTESQRQRSRYPSRPSLKGNSSKLRDKDGVTRKRYLFVAIDRTSRHVHLAVKDDETTAPAIAFLEEAVAALPFRIERLLTDRGSCFTADGFETACREHKIEHRKTRPYTPKIN